MSGTRCQRLTCDKPAAFVLHRRKRTASGHSYAVDENLCAEHCRLAQDALAKNGVDHRREPIQ